MATAQELSPSQCFRHKHVEEDRVLVTENVKSHMATGQVIGWQDGRTHDQGLQLESSLCNLMSIAEPSNYLLSQCSDLLECLVRLPLDSSQRTAVG